MDAAFLANLTSPPLLFFLLGVISVLARTDLEIPDQIAKLLSIYLLMAIGFKGGVALSASSIELEGLIGLMLAMALACIVPIYVFFIVRRKLPLADAAALAATYGSISAVTFVTCTSYLDANDIEWNGYLVAAMALMESPAIILGLLLYRLSSKESRLQANLGEIFREAFLNKSVFLILGSLIVGWISGPAGKAQISVFIDGLFVGILCLFLLDMGIVATKRINEIRSSKKKVKAKHLLAWGIGLPLLNATLAIGLATAFSLPLGDAILLCVLGASASYIAVPAALRFALPEANPSLYLTMSLGITFPFNIIIGIPLYHQIIEWLG